MYADVAEFVFVISEVALSTVVVIVMRLATYMPHSFFPRFFVRVYISARL